MLNKQVFRIFNSQKLLIIALIFNSLIAFSQPIKSFSTDPVQFLKEFESFITSADKQQGKELFKQFEQHWLTSMNASSQQTVILTSNAMLKKRMTAIPNFRDYLSCLIAYSESKKPLDLYTDWNKQLNELIPKISAGKFDQYLNTSENFFRYNALYKSDAVAWYIGDSNIKFGFDSLPNITISTTNLRGITRNDSTIIYNTSGVFYPTKYQFEGKGGKLLWERAGLKEAEANATLKKYQLTLKTTKFSSDSAVFIFPKYFKEPLIGQVNEKLTDNPSSRETTYPRFRSYNTEFSIPGIFKNIDYIGGLTIQGAQLLGSGNESSPAKFIFKREGKPFIQIESSAFLIEKNSLQSSQAAVKIRIEEDSIIHPGLIFRYLDDKKQFYLLRNNEGTSKTTFSNTYHKLDMDFEVLEWKVDESTLRFKAIPGAVESKALFESSDYFR